VPPAIESFVSLRRLSLIGNQIFELPQQISGLVNLERLWLDGNLLQVIEGFLFVELVLC
jgi:Leucine-rich repeat (LRR) protein